MIRTSRTAEVMNVGQLRKTIANLPDDMLVMTDDSEAPMDEAFLYVAPAHRKGTIYRSISEGHLNPTTDWARQIYGDYENIHVLLISQFDNGDAADITPHQERPDVIEGDIALRELT
jgi:hypothetical protein